MIGPSIRMIIDFKINFQVFFPCWNSSAEIVDWMQARYQGVSETDFMQLWADFQSKVLRTWDEETGNKDTPIILWSSHLTQESVIEKYLNKDRYGHIICCEQILQP